MAGQATTTTGRGRRKKVDETKLAELNEASRKLGRQRQSAAKPAEAPKKTGRRKAAAPATGLGKQSQSDGGAAPAAATPPAKKTGRRKAAVAPGKQRQSSGNGNGAGSAGDKQGATAAGKAGESGGVSGEVRGGSKQVLITEVAIGGRGGRPRDDEEYPFSMLERAHKEPDGRIIGPSFFIPKSDRAEGRLAAARKREKDLFWSRKVFEQVNGRGSKVEGLRIWRGTPELAKEV